MTARWLKTRSRILALEWSAPRQLAAMAAALAATGVCAQDYPAKPIRLVVPVAAGGSMDIVSRGVAQMLANRLKRGVIVDNRPGAGGGMGAEIAARAAPDGYTLLVASASQVTNALMYRTSYDLARDFAAVTQATAQPYVLVIHPAVPAHTVAEFIAVARAKPGQLNYASSGNGGLIHLTGELFKLMTATDCVHVPYKGIAPAYPDLIAGQIQFTFASAVSVPPHLKSGRLRALAVTSRARARSLPDLPALNEAGVPGFDVTQWYGVLAPARSPRAVIALLQREIASSLQEPEIAARLISDGSEPVGSTAEQFAAHIRTEIEKWGKVMKQAGIRGE
jgi:tripartite-type tricarboxylate transporter receptor subunit TctC